MTLVGYAWELAALGFIVSVPFICFKRAPKEKS